MKYLAKILYESLPYKLTEVTTSDLIGICYTNKELPKNKSDVYLLISILMFMKIFKRKRNGLYLIDHSKAGLLND